MILLYLVGLWTLAPAPSSNLKWYSFNEGMALAKKQNKQVLVDVYTDWCGWCKVMDQQTYADPGVTRYLNEKYVLIKLNPEKDGPVTFRGKQFAASEFSAGIGVDGYPATAFFDASEQMITLVPGFVKAPEFLNIIRYIGEKKYNQMSFEEFLSSSSGR